LLIRHIYFAANYQYSKPSSKENAMTSRLILNSTRPLWETRVVSAVTGRLRLHPDLLSCRAGLFLLALLTLANTAYAFSTAPYNPLGSGAQWTYLRDSYQPLTESVAGTRLINGILTTVVSSSDGDESYSIVNENGIFSYGGAFNVGGISATLNPSAPIKIMNAEATLGVAVTDFGKVTLILAGLGSFPFDYTVSSTPEVFETVTVPAGTFANALRLTSTINVTGSVTGPGGTATLNVSETTTSWFASGIGAVKTVTQTTTGTDPPVTSSIVLTTLNFQPTLTFSSIAGNWGSQPANGQSGNVSMGPMITNNSPYTIHLSAAVKGEFSLTAGGDCTVLAPGQYCTVAADFRPVSIGNKSSEITITSDAIGSPFIFPLSGIGAGVGIASLMPTALNFGNQDRGITSAPQVVTLSNIGSAPLTISLIQTTGQYAQTNNCGNSLAVGGSCRITVSFTPFGANKVDGELIIDTQAERLFVLLTGTGIGAAPPVSISPVNLNFGTQQIGITSASQTLTLSNKGNSHLNVFSIGPGAGMTLGDYNFTSSCPAVLAAGANCTIAVTYLPQTAGTSYGYLAIRTDGTPSGDFLLVLTGIGASGPVDTVPDPFGFAPQSWVALGTRIASNAVVVTGIDAAAPISISGGSYRINSGFYNDQAETVQAGQSVVVYVNTGQLPATTYRATLTIGGLSANFDVTTAQGTIPGVPTNVAAVAGNGGAWLSFTPPSSDGGFAIINYQATCLSADGGQAVSVIRAALNASPILVTPLTNGIAYTCSVMASNPVGPGSQSMASNSITPSANAGLVPILLFITGPDSVNEGATANYAATVTYNDTSTQSIMVNWSLSGAAASIDTTGGLSANPVSGNQQVSVQASYRAGITLSASKSVTIVDLNPGTIPTSTNLNPGWNLIGYASAGTFDVPTCFGDPTKVISVWKWLTAKNQWSFYSPSQSDGGSAYAQSKGYDPLTAINGGEGFWVNANKAFSVQTPTGTTITSVSFQNMSAGWNLIAVGDNPTPGEFNKALSTTVSGGIPLNLTTLWSWDNLQNNWYFYAPVLEAAGTLQSYLGAKNYLPFGNNTLTPSSGFWVNHP
jgi:hypothetical protein